MGKGLVDEEITNRVSQEMGQGVQVQGKHSPPSLTVCLSCP